ncbi:MAG: glycosyltransferase [Bacteroidales bacterium]|nr:glycosyltransferase [Bacteroidales bacterium]
MKILCVIDSLNSGGAQRQLVELSIGFKEQGHNVSFLVYHNIPFYNSILEEHKITINYILEPNYFKRLLKMRNFIRTRKYDAILAFLEAASFICEVSGIPYRKWKLVIGERNANPRILKSVKLKLYRWFHFFADYIVANSKANMLLIHKANPFLSEKKCKVIYNIIDINHWKSLDNYPFRKNGKTKIVVAARQNYQKNLNGLIEAIMLLEEEERDKISIDWYGDSISEPYLDNSFKEAIIKINNYNISNIIKFHPATRNIEKIIQESDAVGLFSFFEGFPNAVCEGMACGKPVITSAVSDLPDFLPHDKNLLCNPDEPHTIKQAISYLISLNNDKIKEIGLRNERIAKQMFNKDQIVLNYLQLLKG